MEIDTDIDIVDTATATAATTASSSSSSNPVHSLSAPQSIKIKLRHPRVKTKNVPNSVGVAPALNINMVDNTNNNNNNNIELINSDNSEEHGLEMKGKGTSERMRTRMTNATNLKKYGGDTSRDIDVDVGVGVDVGVDVDVNRRNCTTDMPIFKMCEYSKITNKLSLPHLKRLCKTYGLKTTGTRPILSERARMHCSKQHAIVALQRVIRGHNGRTYVHYFIKNPVYARNERPVNDSDFYTMDDFVQCGIPHYQVFRFRDGCDNKIYQFNMASFFKLLQTAFPNVSNWESADARIFRQQQQQILNPYNRSPISREVVRMFFMKMTHSMMMRYPVCTAFEEDVLTPAQTVELRTVELFQDINTLGNYADSAWFSMLKHPQHIWFIQELYDIWTYRADLSMQTKCRICPPHGLLFPNANQIAMMNDIRTITYAALREINLGVIERLVRSGIADDDRKLGAFYVLSALTLVSPGARDALPWLYQSVALVPNPSEPAAAYYYPVASAAVASAAVASDSTSTAGDGNTGGVVVHQNESPIVSHLELTSAADADADADAIDAILSAAIDEIGYSLEYIGMGVNSMQQIQILAEIMRLQMT